MSYPLHRNPILFEVTSRRSPEEVEINVTKKTNELVAAGFFIIFVEIKHLQNKKGKAYWRGEITAQRDPITKESNGGQTG